ncbi:MAG: hypothetical protein IKE49_03190 [Firmicutes bacterium]|nr:hypothetical protein [Bacillota bacterium]
MNEFSYEELLARYEEVLAELTYAEKQIRELRQSETEWMDFADQLMEHLSEAGLL